MFFTEKRTQRTNLLRFTLVLVFMLALVQFSNAQVTIGSDLVPNKDALLDLKQEGQTKAGLLMPRVALLQTTSHQPMSAHTQGMVVYNTATTGDVSPGFYYNNGTKWLKLSTVEDSFFYMPTTVLPLDENDPSHAGGVFTVNLYNVYKEQFGLTAANVVVSDNAAKLPVHDSNELYYLITYYDQSVFDEVKLSPTGVLTYKLKSGYVYSEKTYMNIIFKVK